MKGFEVSVDSGLRSVVEFLSKDFGDDITNPQVVRRSEESLSTTSEKCIVLESLHVDLHQIDRGIQWQRVVQLGYRHLISNLHLPWKSVGKPFSPSQTWCVTERVPIPKISCRRENHTVQIALSQPNCEEREKGEG
jgi:hypothetical protein